MLSPTRTLNFIPEILIDLMDGTRPHIQAAELTLEAEEKEERNGFGFGANLDLKI
jgi:hypothetical protein